MNSKRAVNWLLLLGFCCFSTVSLAREFGVEIKRAELIAQNSQYVLDAEIDYRLSQVALQALRNGVYLQWTLQAKVYRQRRYLWDEKLADKKQRFLIRFHALMKMYQLTNLTHGQVDYFVTLKAALQAMGVIHNMPLIERAETHQEGRYYALVDVKFDRDMLPVPLQPSALFNAEWLLSSNQFSCPLKK